MFNLIAAITMTILIEVVIVMCVYLYARNRKQETGRAALILGAAMIVMLAAFAGGVFHIVSRDTAAIIGIISAVMMVPGISMASYRKPSRA